MTRPDSTYARLALRSLIREMIWLATCDHRQGSKPNVLLFSSRRGGSTFVMELFGVNRGVRTLDQPFATVSRAMTSGQVARVPRFRLGQLTSVNDEVQPALESMVADLFAGRLVINAPVKVWRRGTTWRSDRLVLKITDAIPIIDWFHHHVPAETVYLTRHPIPQALSCIRNGWNLTIDAHLHDDAFIEANLSDSSLATAHDIARSGNDLQRFVLNWMLDNIAPLRLLADRPTWTHVRYEDCVTAPEVTLERLAHRLQLVDIDRMQSMVTRPSVSSHISTPETRQEIASGRAASQLTRWRSRVDGAAEQWCYDLFARFGLDHRVVVPDS